MKKINEIYSLLKVLSTVIGAVRGGGGGCLNVRADHR